MGKPDTLSIVRLTDNLDTYARTASWRKARKKPNGHLDAATFYWPKNVKKWFSKIERASMMLRHYECGCSKKERNAGVYCKDMHEMASIVMNGLRLHKRHVRDIADTLAQLAHARRENQPVDDDPD